MIGDLQEVTKENEDGTRYTEYYISDTDLCNLDVFSEIVMPETVGQYTGVKDKFGNKIFEGDIVSGIFLFGMSVASIVEFRNGSFGLAWQRCGGVEFSPFTSICNVKYAILGTIYDDGEESK